ncbi:chymotrypsin family serine protease [Terracidiphilus gabretensis]|uniref:hypothetical protein n=1 Tax=Terracidiphilus gabretensis TaxID=1577687 RepID=UPI0012F95D7E|nr:hypothetical protein [Terracidiphilus gabretensis]
MALPLVLVGCGAGSARMMQPTSTALMLAGGETSIDTNCTGCNATRASGGAVYRITTMQADGAPADATWMLSGGDAKAGAGSINSAGEYTPPGFLTADRVEVTLTAQLKADPSITATTHLSITPGFLEPLAPENAAVAPGGTITLSGRLAQAGGNTAIHFAVAAGAHEGGAGTLGPVECTHARDTFTTCTVTYTAPATVDAAGSVTYVEARTGAAKTETAILLSAAGVMSNPARHREALSWPVALGGSGGNNGDLDAHGSTVADCCGGTLGALIADSNGHQYLLSNNHVLARSDHAAAGDAVVQPGLIDNNCTPYGDGPGASPVASLSAWLPLKSAQTNADAAIALIGTRTVDQSGAILELGSKQADGTLGAAAPGVSSTDGKGETGKLTMKVAKSGRTTGLTCGAITAVDVDVNVDYFADCAETRPYLTKLFTHQIALSGDRFSDAGDSGALVVDAANAEPVGLFFAGGVDASGVVQAMATPAPEVLNELSAQGSSGGAGAGTSYSFVGGADHAVSCLSYGDSAVTAAQREPLSTVEMARAAQALFAARLLVNPGQGILGVALGKSSDRVGEAAIVVYVDETMTPSVPAQVGGVRTMVIPTTEPAVVAGTAPVANTAAMTGLTGAALSRASQAKQQAARQWMQENPAIFGVGVGQSLDNPREAAVVIYADRSRLPKDLPETMDGVRTRYIVMDRLHVTRSYMTAGPAHKCMAKPSEAVAPLPSLPDPLLKLPLF